MSESPENLSENMEDEFTSEEIDGIRQQVEQVIAYENGDDSFIARISIPEPISTRKIRERLELSQEEFAVEFGFDLNQLQAWEKGHKSPDGAEKNLILLLYYDSEWVRETLREVLEKSFGFDTVYEAKNMKD